MSEAENPPATEPYLALARAGTIAWNMWQRSGMDEETAKQFKLDGFAKLTEEDRAALAARCGLDALPSYDVAPNFAGVDFTREENRGISFARSVFGMAAPNELKQDGSKDFRLSVAASFQNSTFGFRANFDGAIFGNRAIFDGTTFGDQTRFESAAFGYATSFNDATFGDRTRFHGASFANKTSFDGTIFGGWTGFDAATFGNWTIFNRTTFGDWTGFNSATFGEGTRLDRATFGREAHFDGATFGRVTRFESTTFGDWTRFNGATFGEGTDFDGAVIGREARFNGATFGDGTGFADATFGNGTHFHGATFGDGTDFDDASFGDGTRFDGANFDGWTRFHSATFADRTSFDGATFGDGTDFDDASFGYETRFDGGKNDRLGKELSSSLRLNDDTAQTTFKAHVEAARPDRFGSISFARVRFQGAASFRDRAFEGDADFSHAAFRDVPDFAGSSGHGLLDLHGIQVRLGSDAWRKRYWTTDSTVDTRLRRLRKIAKDIEANDLERDLFILERHAQRGILFRPVWDCFAPFWRNLRPLRSVEPPPRHARLVLAWTAARENYKNQPFRFIDNLIKPFSLTVWLAFYGWFSDCGRSLFRPAAWLIGAQFAFHWLYQCLYAQERGITLRFWDADLWTFTLGNILPFFGTFGTSRRDLLLRLFPYHVTDRLYVPFGIELASAGQALFGAIMLFLLLLALRNRFRVSGGGSSA